VAETFVELTGLMTLLRMACALSSTFEASKSHRNTAIRIHIFASKTRKRRRRRRNLIKINQNLVLEI
jgi:hypothetical protein